MSFSEYGNYDGLGLAELVRKKKVSPAELVEEAIQRIETHNPKLNAVINKLYDRARDTAKSDLPDGPFKGVPFLMKDLMATLEGIPTSAGNELWKDIPAKVDSELARRWMKSGVVPTERQALTGLLTPPGITFWACKKSFVDCSRFISDLRSFEVSWCPSIN